MRSARSEPADRTRRAASVVPCTAPGGRRRACPPARANPASGAFVGDRGLRRARVVGDAVRGRSGLCGSLDMIALAVIVGPCAFSWPTIPIRGMSPGWA
ncbi:hypothetical protein FRAAL5834 [Frankia alni ACN14a]|uniref:Uncharacterized protein n=1 Tax=Frankia alni (strain DSM 45986 / CECT 9034 / ACN14a) TaxID=326424 RepID=Q0RAK1_FRAAA|nr:hypothetical protein FRAAL5834 [Frankia alni ACN14a]